MEVLISKSLININNYDYVLLISRRTKGGLFEMQKRFNSEKQK